VSSAGSPDCLFCSSVLEIDVAFVSPNKSSRSGGTVGDSSAATAAAPPGGDAAPAPGGDASAAVGSADAADETQKR